MKLSITPLHPLFVGEVSAIDLRDRLDDALVDPIKQQRRDMHRTTVSDVAPTLAQT